MWEVQGKEAKDETSRPLLSSRSLDHTCLVTCLPVCSFYGLCVKCSTLAWPCWVSLH